MALVEKFKLRLLQDVRGKWCPGHWIFFDSETYAREDGIIESHYFRLGWTCYWDRWSNYWTGLREWKYWEDEEAVCDYFQKLAMREKQVYLVGHNIFFDLQACGFFKYFTEWKWKVDFLYDKGMTYILRCKKGKATLTVLSTTNWFGQKLSEVGEVVGLEKGEVDFETPTQEELKVYCRRDVEILVEIMKYYINFIRKHRLGKLALTKASQAFTAYRHRFMDHKILLHEKEEATLMEREAYMGGRVECFRIGEQEGGPFLLLDVNSMYPFVMKIMEYPREIVEYNVHFDIDRYDDILKSHCVIAEVEIDTPEPAFAVRIPGKTIFPIGRFACYLCTTGMQYAIGQGYVKKIRNVAIYRKADLFSDYVDYFHDVKNVYVRDGNKVMTVFCKYMENSLSGKFGQKKVIRDIYEEYTGREYWREDIVNIDTGETTIMTKLMNQLTVQYFEGEGDEAFPAIPAHVSENARFLLWKIIQDVGLHNVLYCDTDSLMIRESDLDKVKWHVSETDLGALKVQERTGRLYIGGAKNYRTDKHRRIKGIPGSAVEVESDVFVFPVFRRQDTHLRLGQISGVQVGQMTRRLTRMYDKGVVHEDGSVTPFRLSFP